MLEIEVCTMQARPLRAEDYSRLSDATPPKIQYTEIEVIIKPKVRRHFLRN